MSAGVRGRKERETGDGFLSEQISTYAEAGVETGKAEAPLKILNNVNGVLKPVSEEKKKILGTSHIYAPSRQENDCGRP